MNTKQFLKISWENKIPQMVFYNNKQKTIEYEKCEGNINITKIKKRCKGYYDLELKK